jgi:hypothetical protein
MCTSWVQYSNCSQQNSSERAEPVDVLQAMGFLAVVPQAIFFF